MKIRIAVSLLALSALAAAAVPAGPLHAQLCGPIDGSFQNDLCWIRHFSVGNYDLTPVQVDSFRAFDRGPSRHTVSLERAPWGGDFFAWIDGGITKRWQSGNAYPTIATLSWDAVLNMDSTEIAQLSPAEKLDILLGNHNFEITRHEMRYRGPMGNVVGFEGFCNGVRAAGALTSEPLHSVRRVSPDGIPVVFETTDLKALLGAAFFYLGENNNYAYIGDNRTTVDPNAGAFDIALRMVLGHSDRVFFMDEQPEEMIFNHTIVGYERNLVSESPARPDGSRTLVFETSVYHMGEVTLPDMAGETRSRIAALEDDCCIDTDTYSYELTVDRGGRILDGRGLKAFPGPIRSGSAPGREMTAATRPRTRAAPPTATVETRTSSMRCSWSCSQAPGRTEPPAQPPAVRRQGRPAERTGR